MIPRKTFARGLINYANTLSVISSVKGELKIPDVFFFGKARGKTFSQSSAASIFSDDGKNVDITIKAPSNITSMDIGSLVTGKTFDPIPSNDTAILTTEVTNMVTPLDTNINRFQNNDVPGTYLYAGEEESQAIRESFPNFTEEGLAFNVANEPGDDLEPLYRFQSLNTPGTYLFAGEEERASINENFSDAFTEEDLAFYVYGVRTGKGEEFIRFQNSDRPGTYLFAGQEEAQSIRANFPNFDEEGAAF